MSARRGEEEDEGEEAEEAEEEKEEEEEAKEEENKEGKERRRTCLTIDASENPPAKYCSSASFSSVLSASRMFCPPLWHVAHVLEKTLAPRTRSPALAAPGAAERATAAAARAETRGEARRGLLSWDWERSCLYIFLFSGLVCCLSRASSFVLARGKKNDEPNDGERKRKKDENVCSSKAKTMSQ